MKKLFVFVSVALTLNTNAQIYKAKSGGTTVNFYSKSPLEDIEATNKSAIVVLNSKTGDLQCAVTIVNFKFKNALMEEHFNENYMESEKFPKATFKGKINEPIDYTKDGETKVTVTGKMEIHGVTKEETYSGTIKKVGNELFLDCLFKVKVADYNIKVPTLYVKNIAEVIDVDYKCVLEPFEKK
jgi:hypothetical protein